MLIQIEQECLDVYKKKVEQAAKSRVQLLEALSDAKIELARLLSALGEKSFAGIVSGLFDFVLYGPLKHKSKVCIMVIC
jgi:hypothetical protein